MNDASHPSEPRTLAIDIGGTRLKASVLAVTGRMIEQPNRVNTPKPAKPDVVVDALAG
jgi:polyphosphate glucokinase